MEGEGERKEITYAELEICLMKNYRKSVCNFTKKMIGQPVLLLGGCHVMHEVILVKPMCNRACYSTELRSAEQAAEINRKLRDPEHGCKSNRERSASLLN